MAADLATTVRTVSGGIDALKKLAGLALDTQNIELREGLHELREQLLEVKESLLEIREENLGLKEDNIALRKRVIELEQPVVQELTLKGFGYYTNDNVGPYCPNCYEKSKRKERLSVTGPLFMCKVCSHSGMK